MMTFKLPRDNTAAKEDKFTDFMSRKPGVFTVLRACFIIFRQAFWHCLAGAVTIIRLLDPGSDS